MAASHPPWINKTYPQVIRLACHSRHLGHHSSKIDNIMIPLLPQGTFHVEGGYAMLT